MQTATQDESTRVDVYYIRKVTVGSKKPNRDGVKLIIIPPLIAELLGVYTDPFATVAWSIRTDQEGRRYLQVSKSDQPPGGNRSGISWQNSSSYGRHGGRRVTIPMAMAADLGFGTKYMWGTWVASSDGTVRLYPRESGPKSRAVNPIEIRKVPESLDKGSFL